MECSLIVSIAAFGPGDPGSNPGWFAVSTSKKLSVTNSKYHNPAMGGILVDIHK